MYDRDLDAPYGRPLGLIEQAGVSPVGTTFGRSSTGHEMEPWEAWLLVALLVLIVLGLWKLVELAMWAGSHVRITIV